MLIRTIGPPARVLAGSARMCLALGLFCAELALTLDSPDVCSMSCCIEQRHCCCVPRHDRVAGQSPAPKEHEQVIVATVSSRCPEGCLAPLPSSRQLREGRRSRTPFVTAIRAILL